jgi:hypothetical protein
VGEAIWGRGDHDFLFYLSWGAWGGFVWVQIGGGGGRVCFLSRAGGFKPLIYIFWLVEVLGDS